MTVRVCVWGVRVCRCVWEWESEGVCRWEESETWNREFLTFTLPVFSFLFWNKIKCWAASWTVWGPTWATAAVFLHSHHGHYEHDQLYETDHHPLQHLPNFCLLQLAKILWKPEQPESDSDPADGGYTLFMTTELNEHAVCIILDRAVCLFSVSVV